MNNLFKNLLILSIFFLPVYFVYSDYAPDGSIVVTSGSGFGVASTTEGVTTTLATNLPEILVIFGALVALGIVLRLVKRTIGRRA